MMTVQGDCMHAGFGSMHGCSRMRLAINFTASVFMTVTVAYMLDSNSYITFILYTTSI